MLCRIDFEQSELKDYAADSSRAGHKYCKLVYVAKSLTRTQRSLYGDRNTRFVQIDNPRTLADNTVDPVDEKQMIESFNAKEPSDMYIERVAVSIPPTYMSYEGKPIVDALGNKRVYTQIELPCIMKLTANGEVPKDPMGTLEARALSMRQRRIDAGEWAPVDIVAAPSPEVIDELVDEHHAPAAPSAFGAQR